MKITIHYIIALVLVMCSLAAHAELAVIVHPSNAVELSKDDIQRIFLGKNRSFPNGGEAVPISYEFSTQEAEEFSTNVLGKTPKQLKAYWAKMIFTGQGTPPKEMETGAQVLELISKNPNLIGFVPVGTESANVRVVGKF